MSENRKSRRVRVATAPSPRAPSGPQALAFAQFTGKSVAIQVAGSTPRQSAAAESAVSQDDLYD